MQLNKSARYGLYAVVMMATERDRLVTAAMVASAYDISENHVAKVLQQLARAQIVSSVRGVKGGYHLSGDPRELTMLDVVEALQGRLTPERHGCDEREGSPAARCKRYGECAIQSVLEEIGQQEYYTLKSVTVATLATR